MKNGFTSKQEIILRTVFILNTQKLDKKTRLQFHVEFSKDEITINKIFYELLINVKPDIANMLEEIPQEFVSKETTGSCYLWFDIKNTENISTKEELFEIFSEYLKIFDSAIDLIFFYNFKQPKEVKNNTIFFARSFQFPHFFRYIKVI